MVNLEASSPRVSSSNFVHQPKNHSRASGSSKQPCDEEHYDFCQQWGADIQQVDGGTKERISWCEYRGGAQSSSDSYKCWIYHFQWVHCTSRAISQAC
jgi:hypothetical protein